MLGDGKIYVSEGTKGIVDVVYLYLSVLRGACRCIYSLPNSIVDHVQNWFGYCAQRPPQSNQTEDHGSARMTALVGDVEMAKVRYSITKKCIHLGNNQ